MAIQKKTATTKKKRAPKKVIEHDPLSMPEELHEEEPVIAESITRDSDKVTATPPGSEKNSDVIDLGGSLVISEVEAIRSGLLEALQSGKDLVIDGAEVEQIDGAGLQLLVACILEAERMHVTFKWCGASPALCCAADQLGLTEALQLDEIARAAQIQVV
ncbi:MAG: STAS domain-containing protein [Candidatus Polarisedimenticolaceae bacterium]|nr:STAS domain-containing protein [Candidatus Polarisedimenticolaceae bacterium]